jgi:hypothetical protein
LILHQSLEISEDPQCAHDCPSFSGTRSAGESLLQIHYTVNRTECTHAWRCIHTQLLLEIHHILVYLHYCIAEYISDQNRGAGYSQSKEHQTSINKSTGSPAQSRQGSTLQISLNRPNNLNSHCFRIVCLRRSLPQTQYSTITH